MARPIKMTYPVAAPFIQPTSSSPTPAALDYTQSAGRWMRAQFL